MAEHLRFEIKNFLVFRLSILAIVLMCVVSIDFSDSDKESLSKPSIAEKKISELEETSLYLERYIDIQGKLLEGRIEKLQDKIKATEKRYRNALEP